MAAEADMNRFVGQQCPPVLDIINDILSQSTATPVIAIVEGLLDAAVDSQANSAMQCSAGFQASKSTHSTAKSSVESDSESEESSVSSSSNTSSSSSASNLKRTDCHRAKTVELVRTVQETKSEEEATHLRSKHELDPEKITIPIPNVTIEADDEIIPVGNIVSSMDTVVVVSTAHCHADDDKQYLPAASTFGSDLKAIRALDHGSALCFEDRKLLGLVDETFGPVERPFYIVRFNSNEERASTGARQGQMVYFVKRKSTWVRGSDVLTKGYDTSNWDDEECNVPDDFSDDEQERAAKQAEKRARAQRRETDVPGVSVPKRRRFGPSVRGGIQRGRPRSRHGVNPNTEHRVFSPDPMRNPVSHPTAHARQNSQFGTQLRGDLNGEPPGRGMNAVPYPYLRTQAGQLGHTLPSHPQLQTGFIGDPRSQTAPPAPTPQMQQYHNPSGLSHPYMPVSSSYNVEGNALHNTNRRGLNYNGVHEVYNNNGVPSSQQQFYQIPNPYWHGVLHPQMHLLGNAAEIHRPSSFYGGPLNQPFGSQGTNQQLPPPNQYLPSNFTNYVPRNATSTHNDAEGDQEQYQQQSVNLRRPRGRR